MGKFMRKTVSLLLIAVLLLQVAGCFGKDDPKDESRASEAAADIHSTDELVDVAEEFAEALRTCDTDVFEDLCDDDYERIANDLEEQLSFYGVNPGTDDSAKAKRAVIDNLRYEIDEDYVEIDEDDETATVDITFQLPDYESLMSDPYVTNADDFVQEVSVTYSPSFDMTLEFEWDDDIWRCTDYEEIFERIYAFTDEDFDFRTVPAPTNQNGALNITLATDHLNWWGISNDDPYNPVYVNTEDITAELMITEDNAEVPGLTATLSHGDEIIATSSDYTFVAFDAWELPENYRIHDEGSFDYYVAPGTYTLAFYNTDGTLLLSQEIIVQFEEDELVIRVEFTGLYSEQDVLYANTTTVSTNLREGTAYLNVVSGYATVDYNGDQILQYELSGQMVSFSVGDVGVPKDPSGRYIAAGTYTVTYYDNRGDVIASGTCTVDVV